MSETQTTEGVRERLIRAAESLFAERGLDAVSLREVLAAAEVGNSSAVQYHFGDRSGLVRAVLAKHHGAVEARRHALLDQFEADGEAELRTLAGALVRPLAAELANPDGGHGYLQVMAELATAPRPVLSAASVEDPTDSTYRWRELVRPLLSNEAVRLHRRFTAVQFTLTELARRARDDRARGGRDERLFTSHLIDLVTAVLAAPVSEETLRLARRRGSRRAPS
jgi:AcrR family transcriptional regulator